MARRVHALYEWSDPEHGALKRVGTISEAKLWAWEYTAGASVGEFVSGSHHEMVRTWRTSRPDLRIPENLFVGEFEENALEA